MMYFGLERSRPMSVRSPLELESNRLREGEVPQCVGEKGLVGGA